MSEKLRMTAEEQYAAELAALVAGDTGHRPPGWSLSPKLVVTYLMGGTAADGSVITPKYVGDRRLIETAVATLATDRALLLLGVPGTAKSWVSEHLAAAITGDSTLVIQCTAGTDENQIRYGWNYAQLLARGPSREALVPTPLMRAMENGKLCRFEELTRMGSDVQDTLITVLSEKMMPIPELNDAVFAARGFNIIATANNRDKGVNELSSALKRRFNVVVLPLPNSAEEEVAKPRSAGAEECGGGSVARRLDLPRVACGHDRGRQDRAQVAVGRAVDCRGDRRDGRRDQSGDLFQRRPPHPGNAGREHDRRGGQGSGTGPRGARRISGNRAQEAARL